MKYFLKFCLFGILFVCQFIYVNTFKLNQVTSGPDQNDYDLNSYTVNELISYSNENNISIFTNQTDTNLDSWDMIKKISLSLVLIPIMIITMIGNLLVIVAVLIVRKLHTQDNANNILIVSLAVSDLLVGAVVMPFGYYVNISKDNK